MFSTTPKTGTFVFWQKLIWKERLIDSIE